MTTTSYAPEEITFSFPSPEEMALGIPQTHESFQFVANARKNFEAILSGIDDRLVLIVGPCSVHDERALLEYAVRLKCLSEEVSKRFFVILRAYFEKPRTTIGWKGFLYDPYLDGSYDIETGLRKTRKLLAQISEMELPVGSEILELTTFPYYADFLTWGCIGARTSSSPPHRQIVASLPFPVGFKNTIEGNVDIPIQGIVSAASSHVYLGLGEDGQMTRKYGEGNPSCHLVLRGSENRPNYHPKDVELSAQECARAGVAQKILIDCSHDNCFKKAKEQLPAFHSVISQVQERNPNILGLMLESNLFGGNQPLSDNLQYGISITDPCLDFATTEELIRTAYDKFDHV
ncbi:MAG: 3-deoxy-7-phosphoheptulonate synthase [Chlamydiales bacterium]